MQLAVAWGKYATHRRLEDTHNSLLRYVKLVNIEIGIVHQTHGRFKDPQNGLRRRVKWLKTDLIILLRSYTRLVSRVSPDLVLRLDFRSTEGRIKWTQSYLPGSNDRRIKILQHMNLKCEKSFAMRRTVAWRSVKALQLTICQYERSLHHAIMKLESFVTNICLEG